MKERASIHKVFRIGAVTGRVLSTEGAPAAGIPVNAITAEQSSHVSGGNWAGSYSARTFSSGQYRLNGIPEGRYYITAGGLPTYYPGVSRMTAAAVVSIRAGETASHIDFALATPLNGVRVSGRVIQPPSQETPPGERVVLTGPGEEPTAPFDVPFRQESAVHSDGSFEFFVIRAGAYALTVSSAIRMNPVSIVIGDKDVVGIELRPDREVDVTAVVNVEGGGIRPRVSLVFAGAAQTANEALSAGLLRTRLTEGEYRVSLSGLPTGYSLKSMIAGSADLIGNPLKIVAEETPAQIFVTLNVSSPPPWVSVSGRVIDRRGLFSVSPRKVVLSSAAAEMLEAGVDGEGSFEFPMVLPGRYVLKAAKPPGPPDGGLDAYEDPFETMPIEVGNRDLSGIEFVLPATKGVKGRVVVEDGGPIIPHGFWFLATDSSGRRVTPGRIGPWPDGTFWLWLPDGEYRLAVNTRDEYSLKSLTWGSIDLLAEPMRISTSARKDLQLQLTLRLTQSTRVSGRVTALDLTSATDAPHRMSFHRAGTLEWHSVLLNTDGTFEAAAIPGVYTLSVIAKSPDRTAPAVGPFFSTLPFPVANKDVTGIEIKMPRWKELRGRVILQDDGPPLAFASFSLTGDSGSTHVNITVGTGGTFSATLPEGEYWCSVGELPDGYAVTSVTYGSTDLLAERLRVSADDTAELQVRLVVTPQAKIVRVSGRVVRPNAGAGMRAVDSRAAGLARISISGQTRQDSLLNPDGSFEFSQVIPGSYYLQLDLGMYSAGIGGIRVPHEGLAGLTLLAASGRVFVEEGGSLPQRFFVTSKHESSTSENYRPQISLQADGSFTILLVAGDQWISCHAEQPFCVAQSMFYGSIDVLNGPLRIGPNDSPLELGITLGRRPVT